MDLVFLLSAYIAVSLVSSCLTKLCSNRLDSEDSGGFAPFFLLNGAVACVFFLISGGFILRLDLSGALYSLAFAGAVALSLFANMRVLKFMDVAQVTLITGSFSLIVTVILGFVLFSEAFTLQKLIRVLLVTAGSVLIFAARRDQIRSEKGFAPSLILTGLSTVAAFLVQKYFTLAPTVTDNNSFCFFTNVFLIAGTLPFVFTGRSGKRFSFGPPLDLLIYCLKTLFSNAGSLVGLLLIAATEVTFCTPFTSAVGIISGVIASLVFREKLTPVSVAALILAIAAVFI